MCLNLILINIPHVLKYITDTLLECCVIIYTVVFITVMYDTNLEIMWTIFKTSFRFYFILLIAMVIVNIN